MTGVSTSCGACKFLRRKCTSECIFAPYFSYDEAAVHFSAVHKVFGASNVSRLLIHLPEQHRSDAAISISYEALARMQDPVYGCVAYIYALQQEVANLQEEIDVLGNHMAVNLSNGVTSDYCDSSPAVSNPMYNSLQLSSQDDPVNLLDYWSTMNYQEEQVVSTPSETGAYSNLVSVSNNASLLVPHPTMSVCDQWEGQELANSICGNMRHQENVVDGIVNQEIFIPRPWLVN